MTPEVLTAGSCGGQDWYGRYRGVKCYPHVDEYDTARTMLRLLCDIVKTGSDGEFILKNPMDKGNRIDWVPPCVW